MWSFRGPIVTVERARDSARDAVSNHERRPFELSNAMTTPGETNHYGTAYR